ncbi:MAG: SDR family NAD(P)-dependent oxidoreductase [Taibaiella sp.]|nr:SDR family NAD(P)-dependent oxidoreductase [Taibaiella sp.]
MARIFITGSSDGLGLLAAKALMQAGHEVVLHARNEQRAQQTLQEAKGAAGVLIGDLANMEQTIQLAHDVNTLGAFDAVIHNAGVYNAPARDLFAVNMLAPYILSCLITPPQRLIYLSSGMHLGGSAKLDSIKSDIGRINYSDTKLHVLMLCKAMAPRWPGTFSNAVDPGWVPTKMGGRGAPDSLTKGYETQVWLAASNDEKAKVTGRYFHHQRETRYNLAADDEQSQDKLMRLCGEVTGVAVPGRK